MVDLIQFLSNQQDATLPIHLDGLLLCLLNYLKQHRCLLILDNLESILQGGDGTSRYRKGYEGYGQLLEKIAEVRHQSCLLLTSREKPQNLGRLAGHCKPVRILELGGLDYDNGRQIFAEIGMFVGSENAWEDLIDFYNGNPLALELAANHILEVFLGNVEAFLRKGKPIFDDLKDLLDWHFERLSTLEKEVLHWLAINREPTSILDLKDDILSAAAQEQLPSALQSLQRRLPIESKPSGFTLQPVLMEYITDRLIDQVCFEIQSKQIAVLHCHALLKAQAKDYVRQAQARLILMPIIQRLNTIAESKDSPETYLAAILATLQLSFQQQKLNQSPPPSYAGGNILNLLCQITKDINNYNFSNLSVWQAYLQGINLHDVNFSGADLSNCVFNQTFGSVFSVAFSFDGQFLAAGDANCQTRLWQLVDGQDFSVFSGPTNWVTAIAFSPDSQLLASASDDQTIRLWNIRTGQCLKTFRKHPHRIEAIAFSPDRQFIASGDEDQVVTLWDVHQGKQCKSLEGHTGWVWTVAFNSDGHRLASGGDDGTVRIWNTSTGRCLKRLDGHTQRVRSVAFALTDQILASASDDRTIRLWDLNTYRCYQVLQGHTHRVRSLGFSQDGQLLASGSDDQTIRIWNINAERCLNILKGHTNWG